MNINIKDVAAMAGAPGLYHILKTDDKGIIVEAMDDRKRRQMVRGNMMLSKLSDITLFTDEEDGELLATVMLAISEKHGDDLPVSKKSSNEELMGFLEGVLPNYDKEKVYPSNVKKMLSWYTILRKHEVDLVIPKEETEEESEAKEEETSD